MYDRLLIATDGTPGADRAFEYGLAVAEQFDAAVDALYVVDTDLEGVAEREVVETLLEADERTGRKILSEVSEREPGFDVHRDVRKGIPYEEILTYAEEREADLVVVGTTGATTDHLGSTAERVIAHSHAPVFTVPEGSESPSTLGIIDDIVVPLDGSDTADRAAERALEFAEWFDATVHGLYVVDTTVYDLEDAPQSTIGLLKQGGENTLKAFTQQAESVRVPSTWRVSRGRPTDEILERIDAVGADLVTMGTRGRGGLPEHLLGSTTRSVVRNAPCPLLSIK